MPGRYLFSSLGPLELDEYLEHRLKIGWCRFHLIVIYYRHSAYRCFRHTEDTRDKLPIPNDIGDIKKGYDHFLFQKNMFDRRNAWALMDFFFLYFQCVS